MISDVEWYQNHNSTISRGKYSWVKNVATPTVRSVVRKNVLSARTANAVALAARVRSQKTVAARSRH